MKGIEARTIAPTAAMMLLLLLSSGSARRPPPHSQSHMEALATQLPQRQPLTSKKLKRALQMSSLRTRPSFCYE
jgi:hypothetical protein